jgi:hypothetical protein
MTSHICGIASERGSKSLNWPRYWPSPSPSSSAGESRKAKELHVHARTISGEGTRYGQLVKTARTPNERREFQELEQNFTRLAENAQWCADNQDKMFRSPATELIPASAEAKDVLQNKENQCVPQTTLTTTN